MSPESLHLNMIYLNQLLCLDLILYNLINHISRCCNDNIKVFFIDIAIFNIGNTRMVFASCNNRLYSRLSISSTFWVAN